MIYYLLACLVGSEKFNFLSPPENPKYPNQARSLGLKPWTNLISIRPTDSVRVFFTDRVEKQI